ncbi:hypothetical protein GWI33_023374 [Rhynchophorus ferrugineus]|uniref:Uncharacterized protein n=1 Tax=Rhynchophorus ferrugineus TaxID=354439 RepID=A0A834IRE4_RHYFE|nr:hypothetical protein GWI33_023374 [Rhynchophorus ferrugineus]
MIGEPDKNCPNRKEGVSSCVLTSVDYHLLDIYHSKQPHHLLLAFRMINLCNNQEYIRFHHIGQTSILPWPQPSGNCTFY